MQLHELKTPKGSKTSKRIVGRGQGSGSGSTSGRGEKGQKARCGRNAVRGHQGGQMRLIRRLPKVGFRNSNAIFYQFVNLKDLEKVKDGTVVDAKFLLEKGLIKSAFKPYKILGDGDMKKSLTFQAYSFSKSAEEKITKAGGKAEVVTIEILKKQFEKKDK